LLPQHAEHQLKMRGQRNTQALRVLPWRETFLSREAFYIGINPVRNLRDS
jgi:hypothetical protein